MHGMNQTEAEYSRHGNAPKSNFEPNRPSSIGGITDIYCACAQYVTSLKLEIYNGA